MKNPKKEKSRMTKIGHAPPQTEAIKKNYQTTGRKKGVANAEDKFRMKMVFNDWKQNEYKGLKKSMLAHGYSEKMSPGKLAKTLTWKQIMDEAMPDGLLAEKHLELLNARKTAVVQENEYVEDEDGGYQKQKVTKIVDLGPDTNAVSKGLEMAYKLKGAFNPKDDGEGSRPSNSTIYNLFYKPEIRDSVKQLEKALTKQLYGEPLKDDDGTIPENFGGTVTTVEPIIDDGGGNFDVGDNGEDGSVEE